MGGGGSRSQSRSSSPSRRNNQKQPRVISMIQMPAGVDRPHVGSNSRGPSASAALVDRGPDKSVKRLANHLARKLAYPQGAAEVAARSQSRPRSPARLASGAAPTRADGLGSPTPPRQ